MFLGGREGGWREGAGIKKKIFGTRIVKQQFLFAVDIKGIKTFGTLVYGHVADSLVFVFSDYFMARTNGDRAASLGSPASPASSTSSGFPGLPDSPPSPAFPPSPASSAPPASPCSPDSHTMTNLHVEAGTNSNEEQFFPSLSFLLHSR